MSDNLLFELPEEPVIHTIFTDVTTEAGVEGDKTNGMAAVGDYDNDGFIDMYVSNSAFFANGKKSILYLNNGNGAFIDKTQEAGLEELTSEATPAFFDYDNDGLLDLYVCRSNLPGNAFSHDLEGYLLHGIVVL